MNMSEHIHGHARGSCDLRRSIIGSHFLKRASPSGNDLPDSQGAGGVFTDNVASLNKKNISQGHSSLPETLFPSQQGGQDIQ